MTNCDVREAETKRFRILALDGGGIKGAYTASVLATLENETGRRCIDHFDLITGTSTGGILAIGLGLGISAQQMLGFYSEHGPEIFPYSGVLGRNVRILRQLLQAKHSHAALKKALSRTFGDARFGASRCRLVIPAYDLVSSRIYLFKTAHNSRFNVDIDLLASDIAMATAAAPTYFSSATVKRDSDTRYVDGGVFANCPAMVGLTEAMAFLQVDRSTIDILSVGTTSTPFVVSPRVGSGGLLGWAPSLVELLLSSQGEIARAQASVLIDHRLHRIDNVTGRGRFRLDNAGSLGDLIELGRADGVLRVNLDAVSRSFLNGVPAIAFEPLHQAG